MSKLSISYDDWAGKLADHIASKQEISTPVSIDDEKLKKDIKNLIRKIPKEQFRKFLYDVVYETHPWTSLPEGPSFWLEISRALEKNE